MKLLTEKQLQEHDNWSRRGAIEGALAAGSVAVGASWYAHRRWPAYRRLPLSLKALGVIILVAPITTIQAERRGFQYDRSQWTGEGMEVMEEKELQRMQRWDAMSLREKVGDWSFRHQYSLIMGSWAGSLGLAASIISRNKFQTYPQKIVQARMWAQGLTIGLIIAAGALTHARRVKQAEEGLHDHSWMDVIEQQERERKQATTATNASSAAPVTGGAAAAA